MAHLNGYSVGARLGHKRLAEGEGFFFPEFCPISVHPPPPASRIAKDFIVMNLIFVQTANPRPLDESSRRCTEREREYLEGWARVGARSSAVPCPGRLPVIQ